MVPPFSEQFVIPFLGIVSPDIVGGAPFLLEKKVEVLAGTGGLLLGSRVGKRFIWRRPVSLVVCTLFLPSSSSVMPVGGLLW